MYEAILEEENINTTAAELIQYAGSSKVWLFDGEMGVGKTTLIKAICTQLGVKNAMSSPTFGIVNEYIDRNNQPIYHFDLFRLKNISECIDLGIEEYLFADKYCFIEWPELAFPLCPKEVMRVKIRIDNNIRYLCAENTSA